MNWKKRLYQQDFDSQSIFLIFITFSGLLLLITMYFWSPTPETSSYFLKSLILSVFILICILGILAAIYPSTCAGLLKFLNDLKEKSPNRKSIRFKGHHPDCGMFKHHTFLIKGKEYCPGCLGLSTGAVIAITGILLYYFHGLTSAYGQISFYLGVVMVLLALFSIIFIDMGKNWKFTLNMALVLGSFLILLGVSVKGNILMEIYFLILISFWIFTRIRVSETHHERVCQACLKETACIYE
ncbi:restriction endonuclease [Methanobacterium sp. MZ-A1]|uniref:Restriction endonuclease n=2 Tax=Methanobacteriaceae TaxID=2159 RepID=A0A2H4VPF4_9EURY|nr:restriction endonuclease [Methanobacterium subterraneum]AUB58953.1 restriction endonuclease [Methanobacterium sp. MZ-A1]AUB59956.1 restriction endonuclease [Methanobacterium subterraneum]NMO09636.1 restriction endonuclease [Methanobacterium subterraneum]